MSPCQFLDGLTEADSLTDALHGNGPGLNVLSHVRPAQPQVRMSLPGASPAFPSPRSCGSSSKLWGLTFVDGFNRRKLAPTDGYE